MRVPVSQYIYTVTVRVGPTNSEHQFVVVAPNTTAARKKVALVASGKWEGKQEGVDYRISHILEKDSIWV